MPVRTVFIISSTSFPQLPSTDLLWMWGQWSVQDWRPGDYDSRNCNCDYFIYL